MIYFFHKTDLLSGILIKRLKILRVIPQEGGILRPFNQQHYKVALLQVDGAYDLENTHHNVDDFDLFHEDEVDFLAPPINYLEGLHPNTDLY